MNFFLYVSLIQIPSRGNSPKSICLLKRVRKKLSYSLEESKFAFTQSIAYNYFTQALSK